LRLPAALTRLEFGYNYHGSLSGVVWPKQLTELRLGYHFTGSNNLGSIKLPAWLRLLDMGECSSGSLSRLQFPPTTGPLEVILPVTTTVPLDDLSAEQWPTSLTSLRLGTKADEALVRWQPPPALTELDLGIEWNRPVHELHLPPTLLTLQFSARFNQSVHELELPASLRVLRIGSCKFNQPVSGLRLPVADFACPRRHSHSLPLACPAFLLRCACCACTR
jgi:hypothetical protein